MRSHLLTLLILGVRALRSLLQHVLLELLDIALLLLDHGLLLLLVFLLADRILLLQLFVEHFLRLQLSFHLSQFCLELFDHGLVLRGGRLSSRRLLFLVFLFGNGMGEGLEVGVSRTLSLSSHNGVPIELNSVGAKGSEGRVKEARIE